MEDIREFDKDSFTIIIPCRVVDSDTAKCIARCHNQREKKEIIVVTDAECPGFPSAKRNWAMARAKGEYLAFIDSDAYPPHSWLSNALFALKYAQRDAVCGAGLLPADSPILEQGADWVYRHLPYSYRVTIKPHRVVAEFPTFNLIVRRSIAPMFREYLTGEDTLFCRELGVPIHYCPLVFVYHRRRPLFKPYWKQISTYGRHRGHLVRLALIGWVSTPFVYGYNFIKGFLRRKL